MTIDLGGVFNRGSLMHNMLISHAINGTSIFASMYEKTEGAALTELEKTLNSFTADE